MSATAATGTTPTGTPPTRPEPGCAGLADHGRRHRMSPWPLAVAHRGGAALGPENTLAAFRRSYLLGVRYLETDVRVTADGVCVTFHDADTRRATGVPGRVSAQPWSALRCRRVGGEPVPRIEEVLAEFPEAFLMIDLKDPRAIGPLAAVLRRARAAERVCIGGQCRPLAGRCAGRDG